MAGTKIRGITIELGADTSGLSKALKGVNTEIKSTQKQLKDVERLLKLDPTNTELLEQKQKLLGDQVQQTSKKLEALKEAQKQVGEEMKKTGEGQEQYDALTREIAATEQELKEAEKAAKAFNVTAEKIAASAEKIAGKFDTVAKKTKNLSKAAAGFLASMGALAVKTAQEADELKTLSEQTGVSTDELQKWNYAAERVDVDVSTMTGAMKKLKKQLTSTKAPFEELGIATKDANGNFRDITDIFYDSIAALGKIQNETERDVVAMELFGKSADELAGIIDDGGAALRALGEEAENLGVIIPEEDIEKANELNDAIDKLKAEATGTFAQIGVEIAEMLLPYLPEIKNAIESVLQALRDMDPETLGLVAKCAAIVAAISPIASVASSAATAVGTLSKALSLLGGAFGLSGGIVALVVAWLAAFGAAVYEATTNAQNFAIAWDDTWKKVSGFFESGTTFIREKFGAIGESFATMIESTVNIVRSTVNLIHGLVETVAGLITGDWDRMLSGMKLALLAWLDQMVGFIAAATNIVVGKLNTVIEIFNKLTSLDISRIPLFDPKTAAKWAGGFAQGGTVSSGSVAIVGEAGPEILTVGGGSATVTPLTGAGGDTNVIGLLETYLPYLAAGNTIVMDSGALVGSIAPDMNAALGTIAIRGGKR